MNIIFVFGHTFLPVLFGALKATSREQDQIKYLEVMKNNSELHYFRSVKFDFNRSDGKSDGSSDNLCRHLSNG